MADIKDVVNEEIKKSEAIAKNIKNPQVFDSAYRPKNILIREELQTITRLIADYLQFGIPRHIIIYGAKGSGKTLSAFSIADAFRDKGVNYFYVNARENSTSIKVYRALSQIHSRGRDVEEVRNSVDKMLEGKALLIVDEVDFLHDFDVLYHISRQTKATLILLTQKVYWYRDMSDESVKSSLQPVHVVFHEYGAKEMSEILNLRASEGLVNYDDGLISLLSSLIVKNYRSDTRIGIVALQILGKKDKWGEQTVGMAVKQAYLEVEGETLKNLGDRDLIILSALIKIPDTNKAYEAISQLDNYTVKGITKPTFFQSANYLQNLGLITLIKKRVGRFYTMEAQPLMSDTNVVFNEAKKRTQT